MSKKKDGVKVNYYISKDVFDLLDTFCEATGRTKTKVVELAVQKYIEEHKEEMR